jgi:predicted HicB family RNase H-like nuclease
MSAKRKFDEIKVRIYTDFHPNLKHYAGIWAGQMQISLNALIVRAIQAYISPAKRTAKEKTKS